MSLSSMLLSSSSLLNVCRLVEIGSYECLILEQVWKRYGRQKGIPGLKGLVRYSLGIGIGSLRLVYVGSDSA